MISFSTYAEQKFDLLNKHKVFITKEQVEDCLKLPDTTEKKGKFLANSKDGIKVVYKKEGEIVKVVTFYPVK